MACRATYGLWLFMQPYAFACYHWGLFIWVLAAISGLLCHSPQASLSDYYRQIHLFFLFGKEGSELDNSAAQREIVNNLPKEKWFDRLFHSLYGNYCRNQEKRTPDFQHFFVKYKELNCWMAAVR